MRPTAVGFVLAGLALLGWIERTTVARDASGRALAPAAGSDAAREDALALRGVELVLAGGRAPMEDRLLDGGASLASGRAAPVPVLTAGVARRSVLRDADERALGELDPARLAPLFEFVGPVLGVLASLAVFLAVRLAHAGPARDVAGLLAAGLYALAPAAVLAERAGRVEPAALGTLLGCGLLATARLAWSGKLEIDRTTAALLSGPCIGIALVTAPSLAPLCAAALLCVALAQDEGRARLRALALAAAGALLVVNLVLDAPLRLFEVWPALRDGWSIAWGSEWIAWVLLPVGVAALAARAPRSLARTTLLAWGVLAVLWALAFGSDSPGVRLAACALFAAGAAASLERASARARPLVVGAALCLAAPMGIARRSAAYAPDDAALARRAAWSAGLEVLRTRTPSSGPWNHAGARPDAFVLCAPEVAVEVAVRGRRAVLACELPRLVQPEERRAGARVARELLDEPPNAATAERLARRGVRYVLLGPGDPPHAPGGLAERLARSEVGPPGFERVWASDADAGAPSACALWAVR